MKLNLGSDTRVFPSVEGWINCDIRNMRPHIPFGTDFVQMDVRNPFPFLSESIEYIYCSHLLDHLSPVYEELPFLFECHRVLKPDGVIRIVTEDLDTLIEKYRLCQMNEFDSQQPQLYRGKLSQARKFALILFGALSYDRQVYHGHKNAYSFDSLKEVLNNVGFKNVRKTTWDARYDTPFGIGHSLIVLAEKK